MSYLTATNLRLGYDDHVVIQALNTAIPRGQITAIVGANGSGKSTLLKAFARILAPMAGDVCLDGRSIHSTPTRRLARRLSILPQNPSAPDGLTVYELVSYGRFPHRRWLASLSAVDMRIIDRALQAAELDELRDRPIDSLSGGQQQRVWIAMTLAQGAECMLLDEPTSHLDLSHQLEVMELLTRLNEGERKTVVMVLHDLNLAARYADNMIALRDGRIVVSGSPAEVMTSENLAEVFGVDAHIARDPRTGAPICVAYMAAESGARG
jgi:iron complex transport system ATP-binding protein